MCSSVVYMVSLDRFLSAPLSGICDRIVPPDPPPSVDKVHRAQAADGGDRDERGGRDPTPGEPPGPQAGGHLGSSPGRVHDGPAACSVTLRDVPIGVGAHL